MQKQMVKITHCEHGSTSGTKAPLVQRTLSVGVVSGDPYDCFRVRERTAC